MSKLMENDVYNAAVSGDVNIFRNKNHEQLLKKTYQNDNIIHVAAQHQQLDFIKRALNTFPSTPTCESLICDKNCQGNTPLHLAADVGDEAIIDHLYQFFSTRCGSDRAFPFRVINEDGNTPAHVALLRSNVSVAMYLVEKDDYVARVTNESKETLLHLAIQYHISGGNQENDESQIIPETQATCSSKKVCHHDQPIEDLFPIVELLLKIDSSVTCWEDTDGLTPLHRAASLEAAYRLPVIKAMLASCSEAAKVHDKGSGNTILHLLTNRQVASYEEGQELMSIPHVYALKNSTNHQRDTPLHLAARNRDTIMVRLLKETSPKLGLKNKSGISADFLVRELEDQMRTTDTPVECKRKLTEEECEAAIQGNVAFLSKKLDSLGMDFLLSQTPWKGNILHALMQCKLIEKDLIDKAIDFTKQAIQILPSLISQQDRNGNTLLHLILETKNSRSFNCQGDLLMLVHRKALDQAKDGIFRLKNDKGETPLHVALRTNQYYFVTELLEVDNEVAGYVNNRNQIALHLLSLHYDCGDSMLLKEIMNGLINGNADIPYMQDEDGLTPLLTAVRGRNWDMIKILYKRFPASAEIADFKGRSFWHWFGCQHVEQFPSLISEGEVYEKSSIYKEWILFHQDYNMERLMGKKDNDGNTPLHLAILNQQFCFARFCINSFGGYNSIYDEQLLAEENNKGVSSMDLIGSVEHLPLQFEKFLLEEGNLLCGHRSLYSIPTTKIEAYTNTIGVIAALLATITFTAAFTVPGGLDSSNGTPLLLRKAMFQVFMVADVVAMSSSVTVLFCLLWIMTTDNKKESILLLDVSVFLVQTSFYATLTTFMAGLYVTTITIVPAIAISTCIICTLLIILLNKRLVMLTIVPFFGALITYVPIIIGHPREALSALWYRIRQLKYLC